MRRATAVFAVTLAFLIWDADTSIQIFHFRSHRRETRHV